MIKDYELIDDPLCELDDTLDCYEDCTQCPLFYDCMNVTEIEDIDEETIIVVLGYDEDWYTFEYFLGIFSTFEKAKDFIEQDYTDYDGEKIFEHTEYKILEIPIDKFNSKCYNDYVRYTKEIKND